MPVTAKLSKAFYEHLGEDIANELVDWFNQVDATYRSDLRELNELNFARFDAKLEQRISELRSTLREEIAELGSALRGEMAELGSELRGGITVGHAGLRQEMAEIEGRLRVEVHAAESRLLRWMFASWATTIGTLIALLRVWG